jgi:hypothetical protein
MRIGILEQAAVYFRVDPKSGKGGKAGLQELVRG